MGFIQNPQVANSPQANSSTSGQLVPVAAAAAGPPVVPSSVALYSQNPAYFPTFLDGYYLIIQNTGTVNLDVVFNDSGYGITVYPSATFECAVSQGTEVWLTNHDTTGAGAIQAVMFA